MKEEISDFIKDEAYEDPAFKKGLVLKLQYATIKITKVDRKNKRCWGEHIVLIDQKTGFSHYGHLLDSTDDTIKKYGVPYCTECEVPISQASTEDGEVKAAERQERTLEDGTVIE